MQGVKAGDVVEAFAKHHLMDATLAMNIWRNSRYDEKTAAIRLFQDGAYTDRSKDWNALVDALTKFVELAEGEGKKDDVIPAIEHAQKLLGKEGNKIKRKPEIFLNLNRKGKRKQMKENIKKAKKNA